MASKVQINIEAENQLLHILDELLGTRQPEEYTISAFQNWYSKIRNFINEIPIKHRSDSSKCDFQMNIDYWGIVFYKVVKLIVKTIL